MTVCPAKTPACYGHLFDRKSELCQSCLLNYDCSIAMHRPKAAIGEDIFSDGTEDKKLLILLLCKKFGISTSFYSTKDKREYEVTPENRENFHNIDLLITNTDALKILLNAELVKEQP